MKKKIKPFAGSIKMPEPRVPPTMDLDDHFDMKIGTGETITVVANELKKTAELGRGAYGVVDMMEHVKTGFIFAVKRIHSSVHDESQKRMSAELHACKKSELCPNLVRFFGAMYREGDVWICMEMMDVSLDNFYRMCGDINIKIPELFIGRVALAVLEGLNYMKEQMQLIHRDVKPSNVLLGRRGEAKLCDFGISGNLTNSVAKTVNAGCKPYMPPERIEGETKDAYGIQADVWSLGISLVEVANGQHPYSRWKTPFEQLKQVVQDPPPRINPDLDYSEDLHDFVTECLLKDYRVRPKHKKLLTHRFLDSARQNLAEQQAKERRLVAEGLLPEQPEMFQPLKRRRVAGRAEKLKVLPPPNWNTETGTGFDMGAFITYIVENSLDEKSVKSLSPEYELKPEAVEPPEEEEMKPGISSSTVVTKKQDEQREANLPECSPNKQKKNV